MRLVLLVLLLLSLGQGQEEIDASPVQHLRHRSALFDAEIRHNHTATVHGARHGDHSDTVRHSARHHVNHTVNTHTVHHNHKHTLHYNIRHTNHTHNYTLSHIDSHDVSPSLSPLPLNSTHNHTPTHPLHLIFVYTVVPAVCAQGLPEYILVTLRHTLRAQPDCVVVFASNFRECPHIRTHNAQRIPAAVVLVDIVEIMSNDTRLFLNLSSNILASDNANELWRTSASRFLHLLDVMDHLSLSEALHVEADNLLYGRVSAVVPLLREHFPLAVTPLNTIKIFFTASVLWVSSRSALAHFVEFFLDIATNRDNRKKFLAWIRPYGCCRPGGVDPDESGRGIRPFAINEMSLMAHYHELFPERLRLLPVVPHFTGFTGRRNFPGKLNDFRPGDIETHYLVLGRGIWDAGSWGQHLGGTHKMRGRDRGFVDTTHVSGQAIAAMDCKPAMLCAAYALNATRTTEDEEFARGEKRRNVMNVSTQLCVTAPYVRCGESGEWTPLWNLHVHSKHTAEFESKSCDCALAQIVERFPVL